MHESASHNVVGKDKDGQSGLTQPQAQEAQALHPWELPEQVFSEILHCFGPAGPEQNESCFARFAVLDLTPGSGQLCAAATRAGHRYFGLTNSLLHSAVVAETVA